MSFSGKDKKDLYKILNIEKKASHDEIKSAYKKLALKWHPDKCDLPNAKEMFQEISMAYSVLIDPKKREGYDKYGNVYFNNILNNKLKLIEIFQKNIFKKLKIYLKNS